MLRPAFVRKIQQMQHFGPKLTRACVVVTILLGACAQLAPVMRPPPPDLIHKIELPPVMSPEIGADPDDPMADVKSDKMLPPLSGEVERIDCKIGVEDLHARMALEARGGQIASFAYYSKWRPRTCSLEIRRDDPETKWRWTADGAIRVQTPHGMYLIRALSHAYEFEFLRVERQQYCGMDGYTNGTMTIKRYQKIPECSVAGLLDRDVEVDVLPQSSGQNVVHIERVN